MSSVQSRTAGSVNASVVALAPALLLAVVTAAAAADPTAVTFERTTWTGQLAPEQRTLSITNLHGDIRARFGGYDGTVEVLGTIQRLGPAQLLVVAHQTESDGITVETAYPDATAGSDRADLVVFIPEGTKLTARTAKGLIEIRGLAADLTLASVAGDIAVRALSGDVRATSERGSVTITIDTETPGHRYLLESIQGDLTVYLRDDASARVDARTSGEISTDFSVDIEQHPFEEPGKFAVARVGAGGTRVELRSKRGRTRILRLEKNMHRETTDDEGSEQP